MSHLTMTIANVSKQKELIEFQVWQRIANNCGDFVFYTHSLKLCCILMCTMPSLLIAISIYVVLIYKTLLFLFTFLFQELHFFLKQN